MNWISSKLLLWLSTLIPHFTRSDFIFEPAYLTSAWSHSFFKTFPSLSSIDLRLLSCSCKSKTCLWSCFTSRLQNPYSYPLMNSWTFNGMSSLLCPWLCVEYESKLSHIDLQTTKRVMVGSLLRNQKDTQVQFSKTNYTILWNM